MASCRGARQAEYLRLARPKQSSPVPRRARFASPPKNWGPAFLGQLDCLGDHHPCKEIVLTASESCSRPNHTSLRTPPRPNQPQLARTTTVDRLPASLHPSNIHTSPSRLSSLQPHAPCSCSLLLTLLLQVLDSTRLDRQALIDVAIACCHSVASAQDREAAEAKLLPSTTAPRPPPVGLHHSPRTISPILTRGPSQDSVLQPTPSTSPLHPTWPPRRQCAICPAHSSTPLRPPTTPPDETSLEMQLLGRQG